MLNGRTQRDVLFGLLCAISLGSLLAFYGTQIFYGADGEAGYSNTPKKSHRTDNSQKKERSLGDWLFHDAAGFFTLWLVIIGSGQAGLFFWQLKLIRDGLIDAKQASDAARLSAEVADKSLKLSKDTTERQLRAYVFAMQATYVPNTGGRPFITINIRNTGQTPAYNIRISSHRMFLNHPLTSPLARDGPPLSLGVLGPGVGATHILTEDIFRQEETARLKTGTFVVFVYGRINYEDAFQEPRWTDYTFAVGDEFGLGTQGQIASYPSGNDAT